MFRRGGQAAQRSCAPVSITRCELCGDEDETIKHVVDVEGWDEPRRCCSACSREAYAMEKAMRKEQEREREAYGALVKSR